MSKKSGKDKFSFQETADEAAVFASIASKLSQPPKSKDALLKILKVQLSCLLPMLSRHRKWTLCLAQPLMQLSPATVMCSNSALCLRLVCKRDLPLESMES